MIGLVVGLALLGLAAALLVNSRWTAKRVQTQIVDRVNEALAGRLTIDDLTGSLLGDVTLSGVTLTLDDQPVFEAASIRLTFDPWTLARGDYRLEAIDVRQPVIHLREDAVGWNVARLTRPTSGPSIPTPAISIGRLSLSDGVIELSRMDASPWTVDRLQFLGAMVFANDALDLDVQELSLRDPSAGRSLDSFVATLRATGERTTLTDFTARAAAAEATGSVTIPHGTDALAFAIAVDPVRLLDLEPYLPAVGGLPPSTMVSGSASGDTTRFTADWQVRSDVGTATGTFEVTRANGQTRLDGPVSTSAVQLGAWMTDAPDVGPLNVSGRFTADIPDAEPADLAVSFDGQLPTFRFGEYQATNIAARGRLAPASLQLTAAARAYGARVTTTASWTRQSGQIEAQGRITGADPRALPPTWQVPALEANVTANYRLSQLGSQWRAELDLLPSTVLGATVAAGGTARVDVEPNSVSYVGAVTVTGLDPQAVAAAVPDAAWIQPLSGIVNAEVTVTGSGWTMSDAVVDAEAVVTDSTLGGLSVERMTLRGDLAGGALHARVDGRLGGIVDQRLGLPAGPTVAGVADVSGDVWFPDLVVPFALNAVTASASVAATDVTYQDYVLTTARLDADLRGGVLDVRTFDARGPQAALGVQGRLAIDSARESDLTFTADLGDLTTLGPIAGAVLSGTAKLAGRVTGPSQRLAVVGTVEGSQLGRNDVSALTVEATYEAVIPALDVTAMTGRVRGTSTFVSIGGTTVRQLTMDATTTAAGIDMTATVIHDAGRAAFEGLLLTAPGRQSIELRRLTLTAPDATWTKSGEAPATVVMTDRGVEIRGLTLASGESEVTFEGIYGTDASSPLRITATAVDVSRLVALTQSERTVTGLMDLTGTVYGPLDQIRVDATGTIASGSVDGVDFEALRIDANYRAPSLTIDLALEAGPAGRFTAQGTMPLTFGTDGRDAGPPYDLTVRSQTINLGLFQALVPAVDELSGQGTIDLRITGAAPDLRGSISLTDAGFAMLANGVRYQNINAHLTLDGQQLTVEQLDLEDSHGHTGLVQGTFDVPGDTAGGFDLRIVTDDLHVLNNEFGELALDAELQAMGDLGTPLLVGTLRVSRGRIQADTVLDQLMALDPNAEPGLFGRSSMSVTLAFPDNVVVRGRGLSSGSAPIGLGDINVTIGGALTIAKDVLEEPTVLGRINVVRGQYQFQGRPFTIQRGSGVRFQGDPNAPLLDVAATRTISGVTATVRLSGTPQRPDITLTSDPPLDEGDILSLIVFNQSMNRLGSNERVSLAGRAGAIAAGAIAAPIADSVARALDLDVFEIRPADAATGGTSVTIGRQIDERLFVSFSHEFGTEDVSQLSFEYRLTEFLRIVTTLAQGGNRARSRARAEAAGLDFIFVIR